MVLRRVTRSVDGTIPVQALLYNDEEIYASQNNVGIYDGPQKSPDHQEGTVVVSTHRLFYIDVRNAYSHSFSLDLSYITRTDYYAGLFKSSPKLTLHLSTYPPTPGQTGDDGVDFGFDSWECEVCAYRNPPGLSPAAARICGLCGVPRSSATPTTVYPLSRSLPSSSTPSSVPTPPPGVPPDSVACPACTFLNHSSLLQCEICSTKLPRSANGTGPTMRSAPSSRPSSPDSIEGDSAGAIKVSFRKGGDKAFYAMLKRSLKSKAWEAASTIVTPNLRGSEPTPLDRSIPGISGILQTVETSAQGRETSMNNALQDLEALMIKAKDMVRLAAELNEKLTAASAPTPVDPHLLSTPLTASMSTSALLSAEPEEATFIRSSLSQLGLQMVNAPVTLDMIKDERKWIEELARELAQVLQGSPSLASSSPSWSLSSKQDKGIMKDRGIVALDEVWGGWNRARGVALIPPQSFLLVLPLLPLYTTPPIQTRTLASGLCVLHTPKYAHAAFAGRLSEMLALAGPRTTREVALEEGVTVGLAGEMIEEVEREGGVCRDDVGRTGVRVDKSGSGSLGTGELRWWRNVFFGYIWDGQE